MNKFGYHGKSLNLKIKLEIKLEILWKNKLFHFEVDWVSIDQNILLEKNCNFFTNEIPVYFKVQFCLESLNITNNWIRWLKLISTIVQSTLSPFAHPQLMRHFFQLVVRSYITFVISYIKWLKSKVSILIVKPMQCYLLKLTNNCLNFRNYPILEDNSGARP